MATENQEVVPAPKKAQAKLDFALVVIHPFGDYKRGRRIDDEAEIQAVLQSENKHHCHKVAPL